MFVRADGSARGTIGGGRVELEATERAVAVARGAPAERLVRDLGRDLAMCCGGRMDLWIEPVDAARSAALADAAARRAARVPCALVTALAGRGGKEVVGDDDVLRTRRPRLEDERFVEPVLPTDRLVLFGAGHVAAALAPLAQRVGFEVVVCDDDDRFATPERFPGAHLLPTFDAGEAAAALAPFGFADYAIILTRDHAVDQAILEKLLGATSPTSASSAAAARWAVSAGASPPGASATTRRGRGCTRRSASPSARRRPRRSRCQ
jgi:xanthine dehydrogenase accessory factor